MELPEGIWTVDEILFTAGGIQYKQGERWVKLWRMRCLLPWPKAKEVLNDFADQTKKTTSVLKEKALIYNNLETFGNTLGVKLSLMEKEK